MKRIYDALDYCEAQGDFNDGHVGFVNQKWQEYLSSPLGKDEELKHRVEILNKISNVRQYLASVQIPGGRTYNSQPHKSAHLLYGSLSLISYYFCENKPQLTSEESQLVEHMRAHRFFPFAGDQKDILNEKCFSKIYKLLDSYFKKHQGPYSHSVPVVREGYASGPVAAYPLSQQFCPCVSDANLQDMSVAFSESRLDQVLKEVFNSNYCVSNIRVWQYCENGTSTGITVHKDGLPHGTLKIMTFGGDITPDHGCFEVLADAKKLKPGPRERVVYQTIGNCPGVLVDANNAWHRGLLPKAGFKRRTIEISIMPFIEPDKTLYLDGGCCASAPWNPFELNQGHHNRTFNPKELM